MIRYKIDRMAELSEIQLFVLKAEFDRTMSRFVKGTKDTKAILFPSSVREISEDAFSDTFVQLVVLNEVLEKFRSGAFRNSKIKKVTVPKGVTKIEDHAFENCKNLKQIVF